MLHATRQAGPDTGTQQDRRASLGPPRQATCRKRLGQFASAYSRSWRVQVNRPLELRAGFTSPGFRHTRVDQHLELPSSPSVSVCLSTRAAVTSDSRPAMIRRRFRSAEPSPKIGPIGLNDLVLAIVLFKRAQEIEKGSRGFRQHAGNPDRPSRSRSMNIVGSRRVSPSRKNASSSPDPGAASARSSCAARRCGSAACCSANSISLDGLERAAMCAVRDRVRH